MSNYYGFDGLMDDSLQHYGVKGQKWGVRKFQNPDGTLTDLGKKHYDKKRVKGVKVLEWNANRARKKKEKLAFKGKMAKANVQKYLENRYEKNAKKLKDMSYEDLVKLHKSNRYLDIMSREWMDDDEIPTTLVSRIDSVTTGIGNRWASNFTFNKTLNQFTPEKGARYINSKRLAAQTYDHYNH